MKSSTSLKLGVDNTGGFPVLTAESPKSLKKEKGLAVGFDGFGSTRTAYLDVESSPNARKRQCINFEGSTKSTFRPSDHCAPTNKVMYVNVRESWARILEIPTIMDTCIPHLKFDCDIPSTNANKMDNEQNCQTKVVLALLIIVKHVQGHLHTESVRMFECFANLSDPKERRRAAEAAYVIGELAEMHDWGDQLSMQNLMSVDVFLTIRSWFSKLQTGIYSLRVGKKNQWVGVYLGHVVQVHKLFSVLPTFIAANRDINLKNFLLKREIVNLTKIQSDVYVLPVIVMAKNPNDPKILSLKVVGEA